MSNFTREDLKNWFRDTHPDARPTQPTPDDGLLTESIGDANDPYNPDANPDLVKMDMAGAKGEPPFFTGDFAQNTPSTSGREADQAADRLEDLLADALSDAMAAGVHIKQIELALELALAGAYMNYMGSDMDYEVRIAQIHPKLGKLHNR